MGICGKSRIKSSCILAQIIETRSLGIGIIQENRSIQWVRRSRIDLVCMICLVMCGSGAGIGSKTIRPKTSRSTLVHQPAPAECFGVVAGLITEEPACFVSQQVRSAGARQRSRFPPRTFPRSLPVGRSPVSLRKLTSLI